METSSQVAKTVKDTFMVSGMQKYIMTQEQEKERDHRLLSCRKMMMAAGKYKALK